MKKRYIIGIAGAVVFLAMALLSFDKTSLEYTDFGNAQKKDKKVQVKCYWVKEKPHDYNSDENTFTFFGRDDNGKITRIVYNGAKPENFEIALSFVVTGKYEGQDFVASDILMKCPSKYEGKMDEADKHYEANKAGKSI